ncbi:MAG: hypothetical protein ACRCVX_08695, partial [Shewanella sp.]
KKEKAPLSAPPPPKKKFEYMGVTVEFPEAYTARFVDLFDEVLREKSKQKNIEYIRYNWKANEGRDFRAAKGMLEIVALAICEKNIAPEKPKHFDCDFLMNQSLKLYMEGGFDYLFKIATEKGGGVQFNPTTLRSQANQIFQFIRNHQKVTRNPQTYANAKESARYDTSFAGIASLRVDRT